jgi:predicted MFS family arabinose efflux permease
MPVILPLAIAVFAVGVDAYIVAAVLPAIADDLRESIGSVGLIASAYALPTALLSPVFGPLSDRRGRRFALLLGLGIFAGAAAACVVAPTLPLLIAARAVNGLGAAIMLPAAFAAAGDLPTNELRGRAIALLATAFPLSNLFGLPIGALVATVGGWRATFVFIVVVAVVGFTLITRMPANRPLKPPASYASGFRTVLGDRRALPIFAVTMIWFGAAFGLFIFVGEFVHRSFGIPAEQAGLAYVVVGFTGVAATRVSGRFLATLGARRTVLIGISLFAVAALVLPLTAVALPLTVVVLGAWSFGTWFGLPGQQTIVAGLSDSARGTMLAFNGSAQNLGFVVGPLVGGRILEAGGFGWAGAWAATGGIVALVLAWRVLPRDEAIVLAPSASEI